MKKDDQWYYRSVCEDWSLFSPRKPKRAVLDAYDELIKKEIKTQYVNSKYVNTRCDELY